MSIDVSMLAARGALQCRVCGFLGQKPPVKRQHEYDALLCPRCGERFKTAGVNNSVELSWALLIAAAIMYIPANLMPVMSVYMLGAGQPDTIISGALHLLQAGQWPLALLIFVASIVVPLIKLLALGFLLISIQRGSSWQPHDRIVLYRFTEYIGRWSMVDVFVVAILTGLVQFGNLARIEANAGTFSFAAVVVLTMLAAQTLDEQLIWSRNDGVQRKKQKKQGKQKEHQQQPLDEHLNILNNVHERISPQAMKVCDLHSNAHERMSPPSMQVCDLHSNAHERMSPPSMQVCDLHSKQKQPKAAGSV